MKKMEMIKIGTIPLRNHVAKDLRTPKYRMRVVVSKKLYKRLKRINHECE
jgi:hypothetical protein